MQSQKQKEQDGIPDTGVWGLVEGKDRVIIRVPLAVSKKGYANLLRLACNDDAIVSGVMSSYLMGLWEIIDPAHPERAGGVVMCLQKNIAEELKSRRA